MITGVERRLEDMGDRRKAAWQQNRALPALDLIDRVLEREGGRRTARPVGEFAQPVLAPRANRLARADVAVEDGRAANQRRVHGPHFADHLGARRMHKPRLLSIAHGLLLLLQMTVEGGATAAPPLPPTCIA